MQVGTIIREARLQRHWSQADLHIRSRVNLADISRIERNRLIPTPATLKKIADVLDLDLDVEAVAR